MREPESTESLIAMFADGVLDDARRERVEAELRSSPKRGAELAEQRRISGLVRSAQPAASESLHASIQALLPRGAPRRAVRGAPRRAVRGAPRRRRLPPIPAFRAGAVALAAAALLAVVGLSGGSAPARPGVLALASLATRPASAGAAGESPVDRHLLARSVDGVAYPYWGDRFGWHDVGARRDVLAGRTVTTVFYADAVGRRISYSIASGPPLTEGRGPLRVVGGVGFRILNGSVLTWARAGHTCVLSGSGVPAATLLALASWRGQGSVSI